MLRRWRSAVSGRRGRFYPLVPGAAAAPTLVWPPDRIHGNSLRRAAPRRGNYLATPYPPAVAPTSPDLIPAAIARRRPTASGRRHTGYIDPPWPALAAPTAPAYPPAAVNSRRHATPSPRRRRFLAVPTTTISAPVGILRPPPLRSRVARRGTWADPPWTVVAPGLPPAAIPATRCRYPRRLAPPRRVRYLEPPWPALEPGPAPETPTLTPSSDGPTLSGSSTGPAMTASSTAPTLTASHTDVALIPSI